MSLQALKRKPLLFFYGAGIILLGVAGWLWFAKLTINPERVFWGMIEQSLATNGVTVQSTQTGNGSNVHQTIQFSLGSQNISHSLTTLVQGSTTVVDEMIATPKADYTRYLSIKTDQKSKEGKPLDFTKVLGVWAKREGNAQLLAQDVLGTGLPLGGVAVPVANLSPELREKFVKQIKDQGVYKVSFKDSDVKRKTVDGRQVYVYTVKVQPVMYANMMKTLAKSSGFHQLDNLDPNNFSGQQPFEILMTVDAHAKQLITAEGVGAPIKQTYSGYDIPTNTEAPTTTIPIEELQKRLSKIQ
jgi:hypothetical protein